MLRKIHLHGAMAEKYGDCVQLEVASLGEAGRALAAVLPGFREFAARHHFKCVAGPKMDKGLQLGADELDLQLGNRDIHIMVVFEGAGSGKASAIGKIIAGILLIGIGLFFIPAGAALAGMSSNQLLMMGMGMVFKGVSSLLASNKDEEDDSSKQFNGSIPMARHGSSVPIMYGHVLVTSPKSISGGVYSDDLALPSGSSSKF